MEDITRLEKILAYMRRTTGDLLAWLKKSEAARDAIIEEAVQESKNKKIAILKNKIEHL